MSSRVLTTTTDFATMLSTLCQALGDDHPVTVTLDATTWDRLERAVRRDAEVLFGGLIDGGPESKVPFGAFRIAGVLFKRG